MGNRYAVLVLVAVLGALLLVGVAATATSPVTLARLRRFAMRQELLITPANGPLVVQALAVTRRWRTLGITTGLLLGLLWAVLHLAVTLNVSAGFVGWFVGAVIAEWRLAGLTVDGGRRSASLARRTVWAYLRQDAAALLGLTCLGLVAIFVTLMVRGSQDAGVLREAAGWLLAAAAGLVAVWLTLRRVAGRPQPGTAPELLAADDALRARSTNVLAGAAIVAAGWPASALLELMGRTGPEGSAEAWGAANLVALLVTVLVGWLVAARRTPVRRTVPSAAPPATPHSAVTQ